jgi:hypothetical protein
MRNFHGIVAKNSTIRWWVGQPANNSETSIGFLLHHCGGSSGAVITAGQLAYSQFEVLYKTSSEYSLNEIFEVVLYLDLL